MKNLTIILFLIATVATTANAQKKIKLGLNLVKGETYRQHLISEITIEQKLPGQNIEITMGIESDMDFTVLDMVDNMYKLDAIYSRLNMKMKMPTGEMEFSSEKEDENDMLSQILSRLKDKSFQVDMFKNGKIEEVRNISSLFANMFEGLPEIPDQQKQQLKEQLMQSYGEKAFKGNFEMSSAIFPDQPVAVGDKWNIDTKLEAGMNADLKTVYQFKDDKDDSWTITGIGTLKTIDQEDYIITNGIPLKYDLKGELKSHIRVNPKTGWIFDCTIDQTMSGAAHVKPNDQLPDGLEIPMNVIAQTKITDK